MRNIRSSAKGDRHSSADWKIDAAIAKDPALFTLMSISAIQGKPAHSHYRVVERFCHEWEDGTLLPLTRVQLTPETGRTHQLRIHCQQLGHPILGCACSVPVTRHRTGATTNAARQWAAFYSSIAMRGSKPTIPARSKRVSRESADLGW